jgi:hypothetical protein
MVDGGSEGEWRKAMHQRVETCVPIEDLKREMSIQEMVGLEAFVSSA